jgi:hypothetical protein
MRARVGAKQRTTALTRSQGSPRKWTIRHVGGTETSYLTSFAMVCHHNTVKLLAFSGIGAMSAERGLGITNRASHIPRTRNAPTASGPERFGVSVDAVG